ncbi:MAG: replication-associated recombination protein A [Peptoniphilus sp.]|nr:replication-associated recombination protein A [Peptoniphilus sp.]MDD7363139.1 replication-associated recombination protein A [Bacillota bacterium]MDY6044339.1 replication-associated recombination protein A [Peptoniphilus sp.]
MDLFEYQMNNHLRDMAPLAQRMRPRTLDEYVGQEHITAKGKYIDRILRSGFLPSLLFYGPPGIGKTTLAELLAKSSNRAFVSLSAVTSNVKELRGVLSDAEDRLGGRGVETVLFLDEIHRFNKSQQDVLLPFVEKGKIILMGATTENPYFYVNSALLSRLQVVQLYPLNDANIKELLTRALRDEERGYGKETVEFEGHAFENLIDMASGDGRYALNLLEICVLSTPRAEDGTVHITTKDLEDSSLRAQTQYDRDGNNHYDTISAFIKSIRGSDPDAAVYYLARMLDAGEEAEYIARRMIISASEDIGNADPHALPLAVSGFQALRVIGMPEGRITLAQVATYLASAPKSNRSYMALNRAQADVKRGIGRKIPAYLKDQHQPMEEHAGYLYPHNYEGAYVEQRYLPTDMEEKTYYEPSDRGYEETIARYLNQLK